MPIPRQPITFTFGAVDGATGTRHLRPGDLVEATNVRQTKNNQYRKRPGFDRASPTADSGSFTANAESLTSDGIKMISRDGADTAWAEDTTANTRANRGTARRAYPDTSMAALVTSGVRTCGCYAGGYYWEFTINSGAGTYSFMMWDPVTRTVFRQATSITAANIVQATAASDGTNVWVLWITGSAATVTSHKFVIASPGTAPTSATYRTCPGTATVTARGVTARYLTSTAKIAVAIAGTNTNAGGDRVFLDASFLDTATGAASAAPAAVNTTFADGDNDSAVSVPSILVSSGADGNYYVSWWYSDDVGTSAILRLAAITTAALVTTSVILDTVGAAALTANALSAMSCGYLNTVNGDRVVYAAWDSYNGAAPTFPRPYTLTRYTRAGATTSLRLRGYSYPIGDPILLGSTWYLMTAYDDGPTLNLEHNFFLIDSDGVIISRTNYVFGAATGITASVALAQNILVACVPSFQTQSNRIDFLALTQPGGGLTADTAPTLLSMDFAATYSQPTRVKQGTIITPGGIPTIVGSSDNVREVAPLLFPANISAFTNGAGGALGGPTTCQYTYVLTESDGTLTESAPCAAQTNTFNNGAGAAITVRTLTHLLSGVTAKIYVYISVVSSTEPMLHAIATNDPTVDTQSISITPASVPVNETIYTFGGAVENVPAPPTRAVAAWKDRILFASGTDIWYSQEFEAGFGLRLNESLRTPWTDGEGDIIALAKLDWNSAAAFKRNRVGGIQGIGLTATLTGSNFEVSTLRTEKGLVNVDSIISGPGGTYYQALGDNRVYVVTPALEISDASPGMEDYRTETVSAALYFEAERQLWFFTTGPRLLVLDFAHGTDTQPGGRWFNWASSGLPQAYGAAVNPSGVPYHIESNGVLRVRNTSSWVDKTSGADASVLMKLKTGDLAAAGSLQGGFQLDAVQFLGQYLGNHTLQISVITDFGTTTGSIAVTGSPLQFEHNGDHGREVQQVAVTIEETVSTTEGFIADAIGLVIKPRARIRMLNVSQRI
jgi:hypothetical protein